MIEQEIKAREKDTINTKRTFSAVSARFGTDASTTSKSVCHLSDRLKRIYHELGTEMEDRVVGNVVVRALVAAISRNLLERRIGAWLRPPSLDGVSRLEGRRKTAA